MKHICITLVFHPAILGLISWSVWESWAFVEEGLKETGAKLKRFNQKVTRSAAAVYCKWEQQGPFKSRRNHATDVCICMRQKELLTLQHCRVNSARCSTSHQLELINSSSVRLSSPTHFLSHTHSFFFFPLSFSSPSHALISLTSPPSSPPTILQLVFPLNLLLSYKHAHLDELVSLGTWCKHVNIHRQTLIFQHACCIR